MKLSLAGSCQCGKIRYEITEAPQLVYTCHCTDCQQITSSAFSLGIALPEAGLRLYRGGNRDRFGAWPTVGGSTPGSYAPIARAGFTACRAMASSAFGLERSPTHHGCSRPGISGCAANSPGSALTRVTRFSRGSRPVRSVVPGFGLATSNAGILVGRAGRPAGPPRRVRDPDRRNDRLGAGRERCLRLSALHQR